MAPAQPNKSLPPCPYRNIPPFSYLTDDNQEAHWTRPSQQPCFNLADICPPPVFAAPEFDLEPTPTVRSPSPLFTEHSPSPPPPELPSHLLPTEPPGERSQRLCSPGDSGYGSGSEPAGTPPPQAPRAGEESPRAVVPYPPRPPRRVPPTTRPYHVPWALPTSAPAPQLPSVPPVPQLAPARTPRAKARLKRKAVVEPSPVPPPIVSLDFPSDPLAAAAGIPAVPPFDLFSTAPDLSAAPPATHTLSARARGKRRAVEEPALMPYPAPNLALPSGPLAAAFDLPTGPPVGPFAAAPSPPVAPPVTRPSAKARGKRRAVDEPTDARVKRQRIESPPSPLPVLDECPADVDYGGGSGEFNEPGPSKPRAKKTKSRVPGEVDDKPEKIWPCLYDWNGERCTKSFSEIRDRRRHLDTHHKKMFRCPNPKCPIQKESNRDDDIKRHAKPETPCGRWMHKYMKAPEMHPHYWKTCEYWKYVLPEHTDPLYDEMLRIRANPPAPCAECAERHRRGIHDAKKKRGQSSKSSKKK
ncbi:hypothetical protein PHLGIDRAFT_120058 [Phlebiopsis gigantea 11061_1 CR5-6]|uniref:Uncharacterized protein n=1 Tax=Phlebiopsis gigantea (strain 11061_1 CR5-6) TaxID=745531 RepID=A0A0C3RV98_PHLG1|nr:hypothetical protein PHLGIDRAFT_120058 [Phlebiopsis gigantea 11061_1 CR5-6]